MCYNTIISRHLYLTHHGHLRALQYLIPLAISKGDFDQVTVYSQALCEAYKGVYEGDAHPCLAIQYLVTARAMAHGDDSGMTDARLNEVRLWYEKAALMLQVTHGDAHPLTLACVQSLRDVVSSMVPR